LYIGVADEGFVAAVTVGNAVRAAKGVGAFLRARADGMNHGVGQQVQVGGKLAGDMSGAKDSPADGFHVLQAMRLTSSFGAASYGAASARRFTCFSTRRWMRCRIQSDHMRQ